MQRGGGVGVVNRYESKKNKEHEELISGEAPFACGA